MPLGVLGTSATLGIGLAVYMDDQFTQASTKISNTLRLMGKDLDDFSQGLSRIQSIGDGLSRVGSRMMEWTTVAAKEFGEFEHSINATRVIAGISKTDAGYKALTETALKLSQVYGQLPEAIGNAQLELAKGGKTVPQINSMTEAVIALGAATQTQVGGGSGAATVLLNIMQAYNAEANQALHYANIITSAANQSTIDVKDLFESMRYSADVASTLKIPFEETAAAIATLGNAGLKGSMAGTSYANMLRYMEHGVGIFATEKQKTATGLLGLSKRDMIDEEGHLINMSQMLQIIGERANNLSDNDKFNVLEGIFGVRGNRAFLNLLNAKDYDTKGNKIGAYDAMVDKMNRDIEGDVTRRTAKEMNDDQVGNVNKLISAFSTLKIAVGEALAPTITPLVQLLTRITQNLTEFVRGPVGSWLVKWGLIFGMSLGPIGRIISLGARFMGFMVTSGGSIKNAFQMAKVASTFIRTQLASAANSMTVAALQARGISTFINKTTGAAMLAGRTKAGTFTGGRVARTGMSTTLGLLFGRTGLRWATSISRMVAPLISGLGWLGKTVGVLRVFGTVVGKALGWLFGWEVMLADLASTLLTGKGIFEWLWTGFKGLFGWLFGWKDEEKKTTNKVFHARASDPVEKPQRAWSPGEKAMYDKITGQYGKALNPIPPTTIHLNIMQKPGLITEKHRFEIDHERQIHSHSIGS